MHVAIQKITNVFQLLEISKLIEFIVDATFSRNIGNCHSKSVLLKPRTPTMTDRDINIVKIS
jgi:hypothetical protein